ncbi:pentatricopeptide repeat (PPR) superfamily protein [Actinidia rufa]|uniref:Pentatricopeptide repeat (PPR) superfamily protein n=1 Tax=Actinidia rufa TaxID=165716 RepID=A0A7J0FGN2_9ERIC|nr:pentatricopeptide repeat (PPR) superfamily protein [Actinidia rufa]
MPTFESVDALIQVLNFVPIVGHGKLHPLKPCLQGSHNVRRLAPFSLANGREDIPLLNANMLDYNNVKAIERQQTRWNSQLRELAKHGHYHQSLDLYRQLLRPGDSPTSFTPFALKACAALLLPTAGTQLHATPSGPDANPTHPVHLGFGRCVHGFIVRCGLDMDLSVGNCFLTMYVRCGSIELARNLFDKMPVRELITWNAMISWYAQNGLATHALELYHEMESPGIIPDPVMLVGVLSSRVNLGAGKVGLNSEVIKLEPMTTGYYGLMSNIYTDTENSEGLIRVRVMMRERSLKRILGVVTLNKGRNHLFMAGDRSHPQTDEIYRLLNELEGLVKEIGGYKTNNQERRNEELVSGIGVHSEKLTIAFGLLNTGLGMKILVIKNLGYVKIFTCL